MILNRLYHDTKFFREVSGVGLKRVASAIRSRDRRNHCDAHGVDLSLGAVLVVATGAV